MPVQRLTVFSLSNAPAAPSMNGWSNGSNNPSQTAGVIHQVASLLQSNRPAPVAAIPKPGNNFKNAAQTDAFRRLEQNVGASLQVFLRPNNATPIQIKGNPLAKGAGGNSEAEQEATARAFLRDNAALLLLEDPDQELRLSHRQTDDLGHTTLRFTQSYQGIQVWPAELAVHFNPTGDLDLMDGAYEETPSDMPLQPELTGEAAQAKARNAMPDGNAGTVTTPTLVIYAPLDTPARLGWKMDVSVALDRYWSVVIDAQDGSVLRTVNLCMSGNVSGSGVDSFGTTRSLNVWQSGAVYYMWDTSKSMFNSAKGTGVIYTEDARNASQSQIIVNNTIQNIYSVTSSIPTAWNNPDAVSASYNMAQTYDYYFNRHGRNSYDGASNDIVAVVRIGGLANAFWHHGFKMMFFGNADHYVGSPDIVGHEITHGVISSIGSQGVLDYQNQSGALNEAFADIFGEMVEARAQGTNDWLIGSRLVSPIRSMANPALYSQPTKMSEYIVTTSDNGGVHFNSGILNRVYYLLASGLRGAIGNLDAERIFYRCLTVHMKPRSQYIDARLGCITAAETLFGVNSIQAIKTAEAFDVVEDYAAPASADQPSNVNAAVGAADSSMFIREHWFYTRDDLFRKETAQGDSSSGSSLVTGVKLSRPTVTGEGSEMFFVGQDDSLCYLTTVGTNFQSFYSGLVHSVAASPEGRYVAFVFNASSGVPTNQIVVLDLLSNSAATVNLTTPVNDASPLTNISYADSLDFSPDGKLLIYDALSTLRRPDGLLRQSWSIFALDMATLQQFVIVPPDEDFQIGNPSFSQTSSRFIVFDALYTNGNSAIITLDLFQGSLGLVGISYNGYGYPYFNGDDSFVIYGDEDLFTWSDRSVWRQDLGADKLTTSGSASLWMSDAKLGVIYRRGSYPSINTAPTVSFTAPAPYASFTAPANVNVAVTAGDIDGGVNRVEFYDGNRLLLTDTNSPYGFSWNNLPAGTYRLSARAYDNQGASTTTAPLLFTVKPPIQPGVLNRSGVPGFEFSLRITQPGLYRLEASTNLVDWQPLGSFVCQTNLNYLDQSATNFRARFYRAVSTP
jgi:Zn-dependent metalloprotease